MIEAHFHGGPRDGEVRALDHVSYTYCFARRSDRRRAMALGLPAPDQQRNVPLIYRLREPAEWTIGAVDLNAVAHYDWAPE